MHFQGLQKFGGILSCHAPCEGIIIEYCRNLVFGQSRDVHDIVAEGLCALTPSTISGPFFGFLIIPLTSTGAGAGARMPDSASYG